MNISIPSFGKNIPIAQCKVQDKTTKQFEPVTIYTADCRDLSDISEIEDLPNFWHYKHIIAAGMDLKNNQIEASGEDDDRTFYLLKDKSGAILGISETEEVDDGIHNINFIETNSAKRYVGQVLIAAIGQDIINKHGDALIITDPVEPAFDFYTETCGFEEDSDYLKMNVEQINQFIEQTENRTKSIFLDIRG